MTDVADISLRTLVGKLRELAPALRATGITRLYLFGSRTRGDARSDSDLDILVETTSREDLPRFDYFKALHLMEDHLGLRCKYRCEIC